MGFLPEGDAIETSSSATWWDLQDGLESKQDVDPPCVVFKAPKLLFRLSPRTDLTRS